MCQGIERGGIVLHILTEMTVLSLPGATGIKKPQKKTGKWLIFKLAN
jgi:hypothetical protein